MHSPRSAMYRETIACRGLPPLIFQSVVACVPTGWSRLSDSSTTPISIYYAHMIALEGVATPRSVMYGKSLARCTRAVYPPRLFWMTSRRWASVFLWLWLGHMYV
jgi:hypothetical protein